MYVYVCMNMHETEKKRCTREVGSMTRYRESTRRKTVAVAAAVKGREYIVGKD